MAGLPTDGGLFQVIRVHGDALTDGHFHGHVDKLGLCELGVEDAQAEPVCQGGLVLDGLAGVDFVAVPVGEVLAYQVPTVGGTVHRYIDGAGLQAALQDGFEGGEGPVLLVKGQVVDENNKLLGPVGQVPHQLRDVTQLLFWNLNKPQVLKTRNPQQSLDCGGLAGAGHAVEQHVVDLLPGHQQPGIFDHLAALALVAQEGVLRHEIGVGHRVEPAILPHKGVVAGEESAAVDAIELGQRLKGGQGAPVPLRQQPGGLPPVLRQQREQSFLQFCRVQVRQGGEHRHVPAGRLG